MVVKNQSSLLVQRKNDNMIKNLMSRNLTIFGPSSVKMAFHNLEYQ